MLFLKLKPGHKRLAGVSDATIDLLEDLQNDLLKHNEP